MIMIIIIMIIIIIIMIRWRSTTLTSRWATLRRTSRLMRIRVSGRGWTSLYRSQWWRWWWLWWWVGRWCWYINTDDNHLDGHYYVVYYNYDHYSNHNLFFSQSAQCSGSKWPSEEGREGQVIYFIIMMFHHHHQHHNHHDWNHNKQDEHRFAGLVLAAQRGFAAAREQDDVRRLQYRGRDGHHNTGDWSWFQLSWSWCENKVMHY